MQSACVLIDAIFDASWLSDLLADVGYVPTQCDL